MTTDNFCFYLQNSLIQTSQTGGQWYSDTSPFSIPCLGLPFLGVRYCDADLNFISQLNVLKAPPYPKNGRKIILRSFMNPVQVFF